MGWEEVTEDQFLACREAYGVEDAGEVSAWIGPQSPFRRRGRIKALAWRQSGRVLAQVLILFPDGVDSAWFCHYHEVADADAVEPSALVRHSEGRELIGPIHFSTWGRYRFWASSEGQEPFAGEAGDDRAAHQRFRAAGFQTYASYQSVLVSDLSESLRVGESLGVTRGLQACGVEEYGSDDLPALLEVLHGLSLEIFADNLLYTPIPLQEFQQLSATAPGRETHLVVARDAAGPLGFAYSYDGGVWEGRSTAVLKTLGVHPRGRKQGIAYALAYLCHRHWDAKGTASIIHATMKVENHSRSMSANFGEAFRSYELLALKP